MIIPIRCFSCGKEISSKWESYEYLISTSKPSDEALDELDLKRYCCRRMFLGHVDIISKLIKFDVLRDINFYEYK